MVIIESYYYKNHLGQCPQVIEIIFQMYLLAAWFNCLDEAVEDAIYNSNTMRKFMGFDFMQVSVQATTSLYRFRKFINMG